MIARLDQEIDGATAAAQRVVEVHKILTGFLRSGLTLAEIDGFVHATLESLDCRSAFLRYRMPGMPPFPSNACLSPNACIVHGTHLMPSSPLVPGDLLSVDIGVVHQGWIGDAAWTYAIEELDEVGDSLMACGRDSLRLGIETMKVGRPLLDWAKATQAHVETICGFRLVRGLGGHGYGRSLHDPPFIANVVPTRPGEWPDAMRTFEPGMLLAVEPMIVEGAPETRTEGRTWPIRTADGSRAVHYEANVLVTEEGPRNLTAAMTDLPDIVG